MLFLFSTAIITNKITVRLQSSACRLSIYNMQKIVHKLCRRIKNPQLSHAIARTLQVYYSKN